MARERFDGGPTGGRGESGGPHGADTLSWADVSEAISSRLEGSGMEPPGFAFDPDDDKLGRFEIRGVLGRGGQGVVLLAWDPRRECLVAMKLPAIGGPAADVGRIVADARDASRLRHPNVVIVHEVNTLFEGVLDYIILEHCEGGSLADWLRRHAEAGGGGPPLPPRRVCGFLAPVANAVAYAHRKDRLHRDIKPGNVLLRHRPEVEEPAALDDFQPVITDFGLAVPYDRATGTTEERAGEGTAAYMAPEQLERRPVGPAADIYSLGVILYELLCGGRLYEETDREELAEAVRRGRWRPLRERVDVPVEVARVVERCLALDPGDRYPSAGLVAEDLRRLARGEEPIGVRDLPWRTRVRHLVRRRRGTLVASMLLGAILVGGGVGALWLRDRSERLHVEGQRTTVSRLAVASAGELAGVVESLDLGLDWVRACVAELSRSGDAVAGRNGRFALLRVPDSDALYPALVELLESPPADWGPLADLYARYRDDLADRLRATIAAEPPPEVDVAARARHDKQRAAAVCVLLLRGDESAWQHLRFTPQPQVRSFVIEYLGPAGIGPKRLLGVAEDDALDASIRAAAVLALGQVPDRDRSWCSGAVGPLLALYRDAPDAGLHAACKWLLLRWARDDSTPTRGVSFEQLADADAAILEEQPPGGYRDGFGWRVGPLGLTLVRLEIPASYARAPRVIEMSDCEVTVEQYRAIFPGVLHETRLSPGPDCPINNVSGFEAAGLCNRLSGDCRIPGSDWAYEGPGDPAMSGRSGPDLLPDGLDRPGFRLPTAGEFEHAARGGAGARSLFFGDASELLSAYAWYLENIEVKRAQPVAGRKPTAAGFFDLLGNLREWAEDELAPAVPGRRVLLGHGCASPGEQVVSGGLDVLRCDGGNRAALWTFRVARTLRR